MKVGFFIAGVQKGGTHALYTYLREHPQVQMAKIKEPHFFDNETLNWDNPEYDILHDRFDRNARCAIWGEATPIYTYWPSCLERLQRYNPAAKIIVSLRHPSFRAYSHWRHETTRKADDYSFVDGISERGRSRVRNAPGGVHRVCFGVE